jgi:hypothetical protein
MVVSIPRIQSALIFAVKCVCVCACVWSGNKISILFLSALAKRHVLKNMPVSHILSTAQ